MKIRLKNTDEIECVFKNKKGEEVTCHISELEIKELIEDYAYEKVTEPDCQSSSCAVNNFCECTPINEDVELSHLVICSK